MVPVPSSTLIADISQLITTLFLMKFKHILRIILNTVTINQWELSCKLQLISHLCISSICLSSLIWVTLIHHYFLMKFWRLITVERAWPSLESSGASYTDSWPRNGSSAFSPVSFEHCCLRPPLQGWCGIPVCRWVPLPAGSSAENPLAVERWTESLLITSLPSWSDLTMRPDLLNCLVPYVEASQGERNCDWEGVLRDLVAFWIPSSYMFLVFICGYPGLNSWSHLTSYPVELLMQVKKGNKMGVDF